MTSHRSFMLLGSPWSNSGTFHPLSGVVPFACPSCSSERSFLLISTRPYPSPTRQNASCICGLHSEQISYFVVRLQNQAGMLGIRGNTVSYFGVTLQPRQLHEMVAWQTNWQRSVCVCVWPYSLTVTLTLTMIDPDSDLDRDRN